MATMSRPSSRASLQGHMALKSSAAIDTRPPKSSSLSIKKQDQLKREALLRKVDSSPYNETLSNDRPAQRRVQSARSPRSENLMSSQRRNIRKSQSTSFDDAYDDFNKTRYPADLNKSGLMSRSWAGVYDGDKHSSSSSRSTKSGNLGQSTKNTKTKTTTSPKAGIMDVTYSGDYLDRHQERFGNKDNAAFTPRTKNRKGKSFLSQSKHYAPPMVVKQKTKTTPRKEKKDAVTEDNIQRLEGSHGSERDEDHRRWIEEQTEYMQRLSLAEKESVSPSRGSSRSWLRTSTLDKTSLRKTSIGGKSETMRRIEEEEEELKYIAFINEITNDILTRGIYSDSVLSQTMERHVQSKKHELDEKKMRSMLIKLRRDLGMSDDLPARSNMLSTTNTFEPTSYSYGSRHSTKDEFKVSITPTREHEESDHEHLESSQLLSTIASSSRKTFNPTPSVTSISSLHTDHETSALKLTTEESVDALEEQQASSSNVYKKSGRDVTASNHDSPVVSKPPTSILEDKGHEFLPTEDNSALNNTTTIEDKPSTSKGHTEQSDSNNDQINDTGNSTDESDYESVAALSMAMKPKETVEELDGTLKPEDSSVKLKKLDKEDGNYSDDFDDDDF